MLAGWRADPTILIGLAVLVAFYLRSAAGRGRPDRLRRRDVVLFLSGIAVFGLALESPLDTLGDTTFFVAHMFQHLTLLLVVPVLLLAGTPSWMLAPLLRRPLVGSLWSLATSPLVATVTFNMILALTHLPLIFNAITANETAHAIEHLVFVATGLQLWWAVLGAFPPGKRLSYPLQMGYLFLQTLPCSAIAAMITFSTGVIYVPYATAVHPAFLSALADQELGGLLMWLGMPTYLFCAMAVIFFVWAGEEGRLDAASDETLGNSGDSKDRRAAVQRPVGVAD